MTQNPGSQDPYQHDPNAPRQEPQGGDYGSQGGYQPAPGYGSAPGYDGGAPAAPVAKPSSVGLAEKLTYAGGVLTLIGAVMSLFTNTDEVREQVREQLEAAGQSVSPEAVDQAMQFGTITALIFGVVAAAIWFLVGFFLGKGKGWARIVATILGVINVLLTIFGLLGTSMMPGASTGGGLSMVLNILSGVLAAAIVFLIWKKESSAYFQATR